MRELKFRGKAAHDNPTCKKGEWVYGYYFHREDNKDFISYNTIGHIQKPIVVSVEVTPETVGQEIGGKDRKRTKEYPKGEEIYSNDIIKATIYVGETPQILPVYYDEGAYWIDYEDSDFDRVPVGCFIGTIEIIGNIHDNPKLLETKNGT